MSNTYKMVGSRAHASGANNYTDHDDHNTEPFVWQKKMEKESTKELSREEQKKRQKRTRLDNERELEKVQKRKAERELEKEEREREHEAVQRDKESGFYRVWLNQEEHFHLSQAKLRSKIRIDNGRPKPIDLLVNYISTEDDNFAVEKPYKYLNGLTLNDLEDLMEDIKLYGKLEQGQNVSYWRDLTTITEDELNKLRKFEAGNAYVGERGTVIHSSVADAVVAVFKGKQLPDLRSLEERVVKMLDGKEIVDVGYWETLLKQLRVYIARKQLRAMHKEQLQRKMFKLKQEQGIESAYLFPINRKESNDEGKAKTTQSNEPEASGSGKYEGIDGDDDDDEEDDEAKRGDPCRAEYDRNNYSPEMIQPADIPPGTIIYDVETDVKNLERLRRQVRLTGQAQADEDEDLIRQAQQGMNAEECQFSVEVPLTQQAVPIWSDKYKPRKPRFFNRVHTGFEWNKYNQTHYDIDNPPPKVVQGYKFNIFYPDLMDKTKIPGYTVLQCPDNPEFSILRFKAGAPYEDIAFKVVSKEWECSNRHGFRCQFYNNIFQLWFKFKRYRYRR